MKGRNLLLHETNVLPSAQGVLTARFGMELGGSLQVILTPKNCVSTLKST